MNRFFKSFIYAAKGLRYSFRTQLNFRFHVSSAALAIVLGFMLKISVFEWLWVLVSVALVVLAELLNTAIETLVDLVSPGYHEKAGIVKDVSAAAVLIAAFFALAVALLIFVPRLI